MIDSEIGRKIREARKKKGMTQAELGQKIGTTAAWIWMYENGRRPLGVGDPVRADKRRGG